MRRTYRELAPIMTQEDEKAAKQKRLAEALRANLRRRKAAGRAAREVDEANKEPAKAETQDGSQRG